MSALAISNISVTNESQNPPKVMTAHEGTEDFSGLLIIVVTNPNVTGQVPHQGDHGYHIAYTDIHGYHKNATEMRCTMHTGNQYKFSK